FLWNVEHFVSIYTVSLDVDKLFVVYSFCRTSESLFKTSALVPTTRGTSSTASASSCVAETPSWGWGTGRQDPSRGAKERRIELGHKWNVGVMGGYDVDDLPMGPYSIDG
ncbi:hypothetical protein Taro_055620, partial [Colocasia esculenta]|nr:hypothetical protein [Colocasia esculenta]